MGEPDSISEASLTKWPEGHAWQSPGRGVRAMHEGEEHFRQEEKHSCFFQGPSAKSFVALGN